VEKLLLFGVQTGALYFDFDHARLAAVNERPKPDELLASRLGLNRKGKRRRLWLWIGAAVLVLGGGAWFALRGGAAHSYVTKPVTRGFLAVNVSATGTLAPRTQVDVGAQVSGRIDKLYVDFNDHVKKGQILAQINTDQLVAQLQQAQATLAQAQATLAQSQLTHDRHAELEKHNAISREQLNVSTGDLARDGGSQSCAGNRRPGQDAARLGYDLRSDRRRRARPQSLRRPDRGRQLYDARPVHVGEQS